MKKTLVCLSVAVCISLAFSAEKKVTLESLPKAVQDTVKEQTKTAKLVGLTTEVEKGKTTYEAETTVNGKTRDLLVDKAGTVIEVEQELDMSAVPAAVTAGVLKLSPSAKINKVESVTAGTTVFYEAAVTTKAGKKTEVAVNADGTKHKE